MTDILRFDNAIDEAIFNNIKPDVRFLPGGRPSTEQIISNFSFPILIGGLDREDASLIKSALPKDVSRIFLSPLDKGLSGSKVFLATYEISSRKVGKSFVLKIGSTRKLERERDAIERYVHTDISGINEPIYRKGANRSLLIQEFVGISKGKIVSLKEAVVMGLDPAPIIEKLLKERLAAWYAGKKKAVPTQIAINQLFKWHIEKSSPKIEDVFPDISVDGWIVKNFSINCDAVNKTFASVLESQIVASRSIVHGDLHCQNILVDENRVPWPIDFGWCHDNGSPLLDFVMLECSLKFLVIPHQACFSDLLSVERMLLEVATGGGPLDTIPYATEIANVIRGIDCIRNIAINDFKISFSDYKKALFMLTWALKTHPGLNRPYMIGSLCLLSEQLSATWAKP